jgi:hypothetical protein
MWVAHFEGGTYAARVLENSVLSTVFGSRRDEVTGNGGDVILRSFMTGLYH